MCPDMRMPLNTRDGNAEACAAMILQNGSEDAAEIIESANRTLADYQRIRRWLVWPEEDFPRTSTQKPRRAEIGAIAQKLISGDERVGAEAGNVLSELIARFSGDRARELPQQAQLDSDLNLSSLGRVELMSVLEDRYQVDLSESRFSAVNTVAELSQLLRGSPGERIVYHYPAWVQRWPVTWIRFVVHYLLLRPAVFLLGWPRIQGRENLRGVTGPVLVISGGVLEERQRTGLSALFRPHCPLAFVTNSQPLRAAKLWRFCELHRPREICCSGFSTGSSGSWECHCSTCSRYRGTQGSATALLSLENPLTGGTAFWFFLRAITRPMASCGPFAQELVCWRTT